MSELTDRKAQSRGRAFAARLTGACKPVSARGCPPLLVPLAALSRAFALAEAAGAVAPGRSAGAGPGNRP